MFVEHITIYNFDRHKESEALDKYRDTLKDWECVDKGSQIVALEKHESFWVDMLNDEERIGEV